MTLSSDVCEKLKERYLDIHPLLFARCKERSKSEGELFDLLEELSLHNWETPIKWSEDDRAFLPCKLFQPVSQVDLKE